MLPKPWLVLTGIASLLFLSGLSAAGDGSRHRPVLVVRAVAVPRNEFKYEIGWFRKVRSYSEVSCRVQNVSARPITVATTAVCWWDNWGTDNPMVRPVKWGSSADMPVTIVLRPGESYSRNVPVTFGDAGEGQAVTFRMRFDSNPARERVPRPRVNVASYTVWSAPITARAPAARP